ncbi:hypothetical protein D9615_009896 [Tricholomella constricta]|uniref:Uncharacterized protein n=1 Tax=Tricholomella constricta TaxID=117010 RepID=A0A8H5GZK6_9AGAR|nr:hypothetical protein D9615_009896 [Tricholomella constricta]
MVRYMHPCPGATFNNRDHTCQLARSQCFRTYSLQGAREQILRGSSFEENIMPYFSKAPSVAQPLWLGCRTLGGSYACLVLQPSPLSTQLNSPRSLELMLL